MKKIYGLVALLLSIINPTFSQETTEKEKSNLERFIPEVHGTIRAKYEYQPEIKSSRFQVRNARIGFTGKVMPILGYKFEVDFSDQGKIRMLDAYANINPFNGAYIRMGQMRAPFTIDAYRSPHLQYFANRSFIAKRVGDVRDVGISAGYDFQNINVPIIIDAGVFNGNGITDSGQKIWVKRINYSTKVQILPCKGFNISLSSQRTEPGDVSIYMHDIGSYVEFNKFHIEAEYIFKHYEKQSFKNVHSFNSFINYDIPLKRIFKKISLLCRYDMMTDHWDGMTFKELQESKKEAEISDYARHRITAGTTLSIAKPFKADLRINYENYMYRDGAIVNESEQDKICVEFMLRF